MARIVVLVGMMGSGKTAVGKRLAVRLGAKFRDTDDIVVSQTGKSVRQIFDDEGEEAFRRLESQALREALDATSDVVVAAAGGVVLAESNRSAIRTSASNVVWLDADVATLGERTQNGTHRPLLDKDSLARLETMQRTRRPLYEELSEVRIDTAGKSIDAVVDEVALIVERKPVP